MKRKRAVALDEFPVDVLRIVFTAGEGWQQKERARWGYYASLRLVCRRFRHAIPVAVLRQALLRDFAEFPSMCAFIEARGAYQHFYVLMHPAQFKSWIDNNDYLFTFFPSTCLHVHPLEMIQNLIFQDEEDEEDRIWVPIGNVLHAWQNRLYQVCRHFASNNDKTLASPPKYGASKFWYALSSSYHRYFRYTATEN